MEVYFDFGGWSGGIALGCGGSMRAGDAGGCFDKTGSGCWVEGEGVVDEVGEIGGWCYIVCFAAPTISNEGLFFFFLLCCFLTVAFLTFEETRDDGRGDDTYRSSRAPLRYTQRAVSRSCRMRSGSSAGTISPLHRILMRSTPVMDHLHLSAIFRRWV